MRGYNLAIDYERVAGLLVEHFVDDSMAADLSFARCRDVLKEHVLAMMDTDDDTPWEELPGLTDVLLNEHFHGRPEKAYVTEVPGVVVFLKGFKMTLPLVIIELHY